MNKSACVACALLVFAAVSAPAQNFPARAITLIVPFAAGGPSDALARLVAQSMSATLGQQVAIENVTGAGGTLGAAKGAQSRPDGYTMLLAHIGQSASVTLYRKLPYDPVGAFDAIGLIAEVPMVVIGRKDLLCDQTTTTTSHMRSGTIKGYAVTMKARVPAAPELPTLSEAGLRDFDLSVWYGLVVPKGTPKPVADQLAAALRAAIIDATVVKRLAEFGAQPVSAERATPEGFSAFFRADVAKWAPVIKAAGVYAD